jgi:hypothetical protein
MMRPTRANKPNGYFLGSYRIATAPEPNSSRLTTENFEVGVVWLLR